MRKKLDHARELFQIAEDKNLPLHIGHVKRFNGAFQELHKIVESLFLWNANEWGLFQIELRMMGLFSIS
ncbi:MAG: hypothetical protein CM1200mP16_10630 [Nitrospina sp.]|nr:MAG: hypothetical protein CM1200mP16_10630 [Nitrospina sp.]